MKSKKKNERTKTAWKSTKSLFSVSFSLLRLIAWTTLP